MKEYIYVLDPGKKRDYAAEMIFRDTPLIVPGEPTLERPDRIVHFMDLIHIDKHKGVSYTQMCKKVQTRSNMVQLVNNSELLVDGNGVGEAVLDIMRMMKLKPIAINSHGGTAVKKVYDAFGNIFQGDSADNIKPLKILKEYHVPKLDLVEAGRVILEQGRLRIAKGLEYADDFRLQLQDFKPKEANKKGYVAFEAEHDEIHDDLVICFLMAAWYIMNRADSKRIPETTIPKDEPIKNWNPFDYV